jgi:RNA polymerase sigma factor (sigma-70 family)
MIYCTSEAKKLLKDRERQVIALRLAGLTYRAIGEKLGISVPRVRQIDCKAWSIIRRNIRGN